MNNLQAQFNGQEQAGAMVESAKSREVAEVQSQIFLAKQFPRDEYQSEMKIINACKRMSLAEAALYSYPKGGTQVIGPSIRLAEAIARLWGNFSCGIKEIEKSKHESVMLAYAWDVENNTRSEKIFRVPHEIWTKKGGIKRLEDPRDIYEHTANLGTRRLRACILALIPGEIVEAAIKQVNITLESGYDNPLKDRLIAGANWLHQQYGVTKDMIEESFGYRFESFTEQDYIKLKAISNSLKNNMAKREDYFNIGKKMKEESKQQPSSLEQQFKQQQQAEGDDDGTNENSAN